MSLVKSRKKTVVAVAPPNKIDLSFSTFNIGEKVARTSQYKDGYLPTLLDLDQAELKAMLAAEYDELPPEDLPLVPHNARIIYVRRDTGKTVLNMIVVKHFISLGGKALTRIASLPSNTVAIGTRALSRGYVRVGPYGACQYAISSDVLSQLFVCKSIAAEDRAVVLSERLSAIEAEFAVLKAFAAEAITTVVQVRDELDRLSACVSQSENRISQAEEHITTQSTKNEDVQRHLSRQKEVLQQTISAFSTLRNQISHKA